MGVRCFEFKGINCLIILLGKRKCEVFEMGGSEIL